VTIEEGTNILAGTRNNSILAAWAEMKRTPKAGRIEVLGWERGSSLS
jgi:hypothetical protein